MSRIINELDENQRKVFKAAIQDLFSTLYVYNHEHFNCNYGDSQLRNPHFTIGTIEDVAIDLINAYNEPNQIHLDDLDKSIDKFLTKEDPKFGGRIEKC